MLLKFSQLVTEHCACMHAYTYEPVTIHIHDSSWLLYCNSVIINSRIICFCRNMLMCWTLGCCTSWLIFTLLKAPILYICTQVWDFFTNTICQWLFLTRETVKNGYHLDSLCKDSCIDTRISVALKYVSDLNLLQWALSWGSWTYQSHMVKVLDCMGDGPALYSICSAVTWTE